MLDTEIINYVKKTIDWNFRAAVLFLRSHAEAMGDIHVAKENVYQFNLCVFFPKFSYFTDEINNIIGIAMQAGLIDYWSNIYKVSHSSIGRQERAALQQINLEHFSGCFYLWLFGLMVAMFVFMFETIYWKWQKVKREKRITIYENRFDFEHFLED